MMNDFDKRITEHLSDPLHCQTIETIQVNIGRTCNLACGHCHLACSPKRLEQMDWEKMQKVAAIAAELPGVRMDITGGSPEIHPKFRQFVLLLRQLDLPVQVRTNLTILLEPEQEGTMEFMKEHDVNIVASLPCYTEENVRKQRGRGVFEKSIEVLRR